MPYLRNSCFSSVTSHCARIGGTFGVASFSRGDGSSSINSLRNGPSQEGNPIVGAPLHRRDSSSENGTALHAYGDNERCDTQSRTSETLRHTYELFDLPQSSGTRDVHVYGNVDARVSMTHHPIELNELMVPIESSGVATTYQAKCEQHDDIVSIHSESVINVTSGSPSPNSLPVVDELYESICGPYSEVLRRTTIR